MDVLKRCTRCKEQFPATDKYFYRNGKSLRGECIGCVRLKQTADYAKDKRKQQKRGRAKYRSRHEQYLSYDAKRREERKRRQYGKIIHSE